MPSEYNDCCVSSTTSFVQKGYNNLCILTAMDSLKKRLEYAMDIRKLNQPQLAERASTRRQPVSQQVIQHLLSGRTRNSKHIPALAKALRVRIEWLVSREEPMEAEPSAKLVPEVDFVQAGRWRDIADPYPQKGAENWIACDTAVSDGAFALRLKGTSMLPIYSEGDVIVVDPAIEAQPGDLVVAKLKGQEVATFKVYRLRSERPKVIELKALNPDWPYPPETLDSKNPGSVIGVVVEHHRYPRANHW